MMLALYFVGLLLVAVLIPAIYMRETIRVRVQEARVSSRQSDQR
jgi:hypothetical protein